MKRWMTRLGLVGAVVVPLTLGVAGQASADTPDDGAAYGAHVSECVQTMGLNGDHNPGMHRGITGWMPGPMG